MRSLSLPAFLVILLVVALFVVALFTLFTTLQEQDKLKQELFVEKELLADIVGRTVFHPLWVYRLGLYPAGREVLVREVGRSKDVEFLHVVAASGGKVVLDSNQKDEGRVSLYATLVEGGGESQIVDGEYYGQKLKVLVSPASGGNAVIIGFSMERIESKIRAVAIRSSLFGILILGFIGGILLFIFQRFVRPMKTIQLALESVRKGSLNVSVDPQKMLGRELRGLAEALNVAVASIKQSKARERSISEAKSEFLSLAAHQLRTPLSAIKWVFHMLIEGSAGKISKSQRELVEKGYFSNERMIRLVSDLLDVVRIEGGRFGNEPVNYSLAKIVADALNGLSVLAEKKNIHFIFKKPTPPLPDIQMDPVGIRIVLENLLENAISYTFPGGKVYISIKQIGKDVQVEVSDNGIGIPKKYISRVFSKFFRAENAVRMETEGSGLGLYLAKNIIKKHKGRIWFESTEGRGSTFYFTLPINNTSRKRTSAR